MDMVTFFFEIALMLSVSLLCGKLMSRLGLPAVFGAFLVGLAFSQNLEKRDEAHEMVYQFVMYFFAPLYFVSIGLRANAVEAVCGHRLCFERKGCHGDNIGYCRKRCGTY
jgi:Kef-type K+ transport system membrane component KefB